MRGVLLAVVAALALLVTGCGATIKPESAARSVAKFVKEQTGFEPTDVTCPDRIDAKVGTTFTCTFTGPDGRPYTADVRVDGVEGEDALYVQTRPS